MFLFIAMCLNFFTAGCVIYRLTTWQVWIAGQMHPELLQLHPDNKSFHSSPPEFLREQGCCGCSGLKIAPAVRLKHLETYFTEYVKCVAGADGMRITSDGALNESGNSIDENDCLDLDKFDFARYLSIVLDEQIAELINFGPATWLMVVFVYAVHWLLVEMHTGDDAEFQLAMINVVPIVVALACQWRYGICPYALARMIARWINQTILLIFRCSSGQLR